MVLAILWITAMFYNMPFLFVFTNVNNIHGFTSINLADTFIQHVLQIIKIFLMTKDMHFDVQTISLPID